MNDRQSVAEGVAVDRRLALIDSAIRVLAERGYDKARYSDVAKDAGVSVGSIQHYFEDRSDLFVSTFSSFAAETIEAAWGAYYLSLIHI